MSDDFDKSAILGSFLDEVNSYLPEIQTHLDRLQQQPDDASAMEEAYRRAHTIAGSAAMMEYTGLARVAQGMEDTLGDALDRQSSLNLPTIGLLRRSFGRLNRLAEEARNGADDTAIVAEDEADRASLATQSAAAQSTPPHPQAAGASTPGAVATPEPPVQIPDWLAAFATPAPQSSIPASPAEPRLDDFEKSTSFANGPQPSQSMTGASTSGAWATSFHDMPTGETPIIRPESMADMLPDQGIAPEPDQRGFGASQPSSESFDDILQAFQAGAQPAAPMPEPFERRSPFSDADAGDFDALGTGEIPTVPGVERSASRSFAVAPDYGASGPAELSAVPASHMDVRAEADSVRRQVAALRTIAASLRESAQSMEDERSELRSFLNGSRDALDRLEEWVGQQMGLDLRNSPDSVRRYLPLSVVWVITTRLKQLIGLLHASGRKVTVTQEQIDEALGGLLTALEGVQAGYRIAQSAGQTPDGAFTATFAHVSWAGRDATNPAAGDSAGESLSPGTRAEIEREVREQLRRELEDEVRDEVAATVRRDEEARLRQELQIEVRRQLLSEFTGSSIPAVSSGVAGGLLSMMQTSDERAAKPVQVTSEQSPEALEVFREEAQEHLQTITSSIAQLETAPGDLAIVQTIRRAMHTLKGAAGMMGFLDVQRVAHASEDVLDEFVEQGTTLSPEVHSLLLDTAEALDQLVAGQPSSAAERRSLADAIIARYTQLGGKPLELPAEAQHADFASSDASHAITPDQAESDGHGAATAADLSVRLKLSKLDDLVTLFGELLVNRSVLEERVERAGRLISDTVVVSERLREIGSQLETRFEAATLPSGRPGGTLGGSQRGGTNWSNAISRGANSGPGLGGVPAHEFDELELDRYTEFHRLSRGLSEGVADVVTLAHELESLVRETQTSFARENRLTSDFQDRLLKARLVPLQSLVPRLYRAVRASAFKEGKDIEFFADGMDTEIDRKVFEEVAGPLLHLVRNAVNHGIETPEARELAGKPRTGRIIVSAAYEGNQVAIAVRDDGAGIDPERIRATAVARGWIDAYAHLSERDAVNLIFRPGISTAESVTEESGRGVGLDVVRDTVTRLRGTVEVESGVSQGTIFTMKFPISLQIARAVLVRAGNQVMAIPMAVVDQIGRLDYYKIVPGDVPSLDLRGERYPLAHIASYLRVAVPPIDERASVLLVNAGKRRVALIVDAIVAQQEVVAKPLGPHLREVSGVAGATVLGNGQVVLILELHELLTQVPRGSVELPRTATTIAAQPTGPVPTYEGTPPQFPPIRSAAASSPVAPPYGNQSALPGGRTDFVVTQRMTAAPAQGRMVVPPSAQSSYLLVVDDSPSVRRVVSGMLKANGWEVQTARDGVEALEAIARQMPVAVLLDIEMPRMDGYELMATVRSQEQYRHLPLIVLTSRAATKHQQRALQLGADAYVVKPYQDEELLNTILSLVQSRR